jgi:hypothetical protein
MMMDAQELGLQDLPSEHETNAYDGRLHARTAVSAAAVATLVCVGMAVVRYNYGHVRLTFLAADFVAAFVGSLAAGLVRGMDARGVAWAQAWGVTEGTRAFAVMRALPGALVRAAVMQLPLAAVNATYVAADIYHETVELPVLEICARYLGDMPQVLLACLVVELAARWLNARLGRD